MIPNLSSRWFMEEWLEVFRKATDEAVHECLGQTHWELSRAGLGRIHAADTRMAFRVSLHNEQPLFVIVEVKSIQNRGAVGRENDLFAELLRKLYNLRYEGNA